MVRTRPSSRMTMPLPARSVPRMDAVKASSGISERNCTTASSAGSRSNRNSSCCGCTPLGNAQLPCSAMNQSASYAPIRGNAECYAIPRACEDSGGLKFRCDARFADRQVDQGCESGEPGIEVPHERVITEVDDGEPAQPRAEEGADLVRQQRQAEQGCQVACAEKFADDGRSGRHRCKPGQPESRSEDIER